VCLFVLFVCFVVAQMPQAEAAAVDEMHVLGSGVEELSEGQLELLETLHARLLERIRELQKESEVQRLVQMALNNK
jgi:hypothetical protein